ncbi:subclass B3 metallo-beta-lactamase SIQ-1 [Allosphingosinicella indica]|uniref:Metallo-beta-lactamase class B n=1 Tax=Allosphingosinicella indica TaxID=941907 RepID=A0A1X7H219_9SPHN|nr:subclass B3 metallo-beta-lactamase [Allosphingosinicella indica]SMF77924.1 metallo-beta-lactamase class B [Allosphingosinicella indica]
MRRLSILVSLLLATAAPAAANDPKWSEPIAPFKIADGLYHVGSRDIAAFLIDGGKDGLVLLDAGVPDFAPRVIENIRTLGFDPKRVRILLNSQAHFDHAGGLAAIQKATGAKLLLSAPDAALMKRGGKRDFAFGDAVPYPVARVDGIVKDAHRVTIGTATLTAHITPGHTKGCTTWTMPLKVDGATKTALFICGTSAPGYRLIGNPAYPNIVADFRASFAKLKALPCDIFLGSHGSYFNMDEKRGRAGATPNPFLDPEGCSAFLDASSRRFETELAKQQADHLRAGTVQK